MVSNEPNTNVQPDNTLFQYFHQTMEALDRQAGELNEEFKDHMQCRKGCYHCCLNGFKIRFIEGIRLLQGYAQASPETAAAIIDNMQREGVEGQTYCPVLVDGACSLYEYRPALCRAFGPVVKLEETYGTCELNFQEIESIESLKALDLPPFYEILNDLSKMLWERNPQWHGDNGPDDDSPLFSIRELFEVFLTRQGVEVAEAVPHEELKKLRQPGQQAISISDWSALPNQQQDESHSKTV